MSTIIGIGHAVLVGLSARHQKLVETKNRYNTVALVEQTISVRLGRYTFGTGFSLFLSRLFSWKESSFLVIKQRAKNSQLYDFKSQ